MLRIKPWVNHQHLAAGFSFGVLSACALTACLSSKQLSVVSTYAQQVSAGLFSTCLKDATGVAVCYGSSVGDGWAGSKSHVDGYVPDSPQPTSQKNALGDISDIAAGKGTNAVCAVRKGGDVACWGWQNLDQNSMLLPKQVLTVPGISNASSVSVGRLIPVGTPSLIEGGACAVLQDHTVTCWSFVGSSITAPQPVVGLDNVNSVSVGGSGHVCAIKADRSVWCWGDNAQGQLGLSDFVTRSTPTLVPSLSAISLSAGTYHTCAVRTDNVTVCWGGCNYGAVGIPAVGCTNVSSPRAIAGAAPASSVSSGSNYSCSVMTDGSIKCWGDNTMGQLGIGMGQPSTHIPTVVLNLRQAVFVSAGDSHACASLRALQTRCWGLNTYGELTDGSTNPSFTPVPP
jgi:hypothetical protein